MRLDAFGRVFCISRACLENALKNALESVSRECFEDCLWVAQPDKRKISFSCSDQMAKGNPAMSANKASQATPVSLAKGNRKKD